MGTIFTIDSVFDFEKKCLDRNKELLAWIDKKSQIITPNDMIRPRLLVFYKQLGESFDCNSDFIVDALEKNDKLEPIRNIIRTVIELYCRAIYLNNVTDEEKIRRVLALDAYTIALCEIDSEDSRWIIRKGREIADSLRIPLPSMEKIQYLIKDGILCLGKSKGLNDFRREFLFPPVKQIIKQHLDEAQEPRIPKGILYKFYSLFSDQLHGNPYLGRHIHNMTPRNQTLGLLIVLTLRFLREMSTLTGFPIDKTDSLILSWRNYYSKYFLDLWRFSNLAR
jgi:hypothetical protein